MCGGLVLLLAVASGLQMVYALSEVPRVRIADAISQWLEGWLASEELLGSTEAVSEAALEVLNLDDYVYRRFRRGTRTFTVYAAYWAPGKMSTRLVASQGAAASANSCSTSTPIGSPCHRLTVLL